MSDILDELLPPDENMSEWLVDYVLSKEIGRLAMETANLASAQLLDSNEYDDDDQRFYEMFS